MHSHILQCSNLPLICLLWLMNVHWVCDFKFDLNFIVCIVWPPTCVEYIFVRYAFNNFKFKPIFPIAKCIANVAKFVEIRTKLILHLSALRSQLIITPPKELITKKKKHEHKSLSHFKDNLVTWLPWDELVVETKGNVH
jgi:hypothetical protein